MSLQRRAASNWLAQAHAICNSPAPFLYQTNTLTSIRPRSSNFRSQLSSSYSTSDPSNSSSIDSHIQTEGDSFTEPPSNDTGEGGPPIAFNPTPAPRRSFLRTKAETIARPVVREGRWQKRERSDKLGRKPRLTTHETRTLAGLISRLDPEKRPIPQGLAQKSRKSDELGSVKPGEVDAEISEIFATVLKDVRNLQGPPEDGKVWSPWLREKEREQERQKEKLENKVSQTLDEIIALPGQPGAKEETKADEQSKAAVQAHKSELGELILTDEGLVELLRTEQITLARAIEIVTAREAAKIDSALHGAVEGTTDKDFWKVCQDKVFSLVQYLRSDEGVASTSSSVTDFSVPAGVPIEPIVAAIYPKVLRLAFVLLNLHFPDSHFMSQFRTAITSLGRESATLGFTTGLFNDMIYLHWRVTHDFPEIIALCREMEVTGAHPNKSTIGVLEGIVRERNADIAKRQAGEMSEQPWWDLPDNRRAMRMMVGEDGALARLRRQLNEGRSRMQIFKPYL
ncbi:uncharacterized protein DSM5745_01349 [Aspergillus mulundensis]|uniref:Mtf2-like C-terminal domain-containing protein n=1 Tax=Aspergillus mulundensis TaxID=1810919 RepID=A0A3D8T643_9EURO|nr:hypothetical protein DSM5745_01349 [Aspergillus mulundensis]RDW94027.1 hypothetical protein DSM5745_01349 [Aspergillus mulundensis]